MVDPVVNAVCNNCRKIEQESHQSLNQQMIPAKRMKIRIWQYMPQKIQKWGFLITFWGLGDLESFMTLFMKELVLQVEKNVVQRM